ncbi:MAG TPA: ester cyclase [Tepidiformaceae bacterium]|nr:ester cyclase [Tepidiformaceae bacterium]
MADYKEMAERWYGEVVSGGKTELIDELCAPDFVDHDPLPGTSADLAGIKEFVAQIRAAFPDLQVSVDDLIGEGDRLAVRSTMRGTHEGDFMGIPGSGKKVEVSNYDFVRFENDQAAEHWGVIDSAALMEQLGMAPAGG